MKTQIFKQQSKDKYFNILRNRPFTMFQNLLDWTLGFWEKKKTRMTVKKSLYVLS